jgi:hypothetical protein
MIEIITQKTDKSTDEICKWLLYYNFDFKRHNVEDFTDFSFYLGTSQQKNTKNIYHRRGKLSTIRFINDYSIDTYVREETNMLLKGWEKIYKNDHQSNYIGEFNEEDQHNKLYDLHIAESLGIKIPATLITNSKTELIAFANQRKLITKSIRKPISLNSKGFIFSDIGTYRVKKNDIRKLKSHFSLSLFQEYIEKKYEIRAFFFKDKIFPMAIFSQKDIQTKYDYRNYNLETPNRCEPVKLPEKIEKKIFAFFKAKNINTGSVDLIVSAENEFYFLENNPQGQFNWLSENCNYNVEKYIAEDLIKNEKKEN